jgi:hypothetical protein
MAKGPSTPTTRAIKKRSEGSEIPFYENEKCNNFVEDDKININNLEHRPAFDIAAPKSKKSYEEEDESRQKQFILPSPAQLALCLSKCFSGLMKYMHTPLASTFVTACSTSLSVVCF